MKILRKFLYGFRLSQIFHRGFVPNSSKFQNSNSKLDSVMCQTWSFLGISQIFVTIIEDKEQESI